MGGLGLRLLEDAKIAYSLVSCYCLRPKEPAYFMENHFYRYVLHFKHRREYALPC